MGVSTERPRLFGPVYCAMLYMLYVFFYLTTYCCYINIIELVSQLLYYYSFLFLEIVYKGELTSIHKFTTVCQTEIKP